MSNAYLVHAFDVINVGDIDLVRQVRELASRVVLGVLSDDEVEATTGRRPIVPLTERLMLAAHLRGVHDVVVHDRAAVPADATVYVEHGTRSLWHESAVELEPRTRTTSTLLLSATGTDLHAAEDVA